MICPNCQKEIPDTAKACGYCGHWLDGEKPSHPTETPDAESTILSGQTGETLPWVWIGLGGVALIIVIGVGILLTGSGSGGNNADTEATLVSLAASATAQASLAHPTDPPTTQLPTATPLPFTDTPTPTPTDTPVSSITVDEAWHAELAVASASVHRHPDFVSPIVTTLQKGNKVDLLSVNENKTWVKIVSYENAQATGWIKLEALSLNVSLDTLPVEIVAPTSTSPPIPTNTPLPTLTPIPLTSNPNRSRFDDERAIDPVVIADGNFYKMWYSGEGSDGRFRVGYATSADGIKWDKYGRNPVLDVGPTGSWDSETVRLNVVIKRDNIYQMWYSGNNYQSLGYATSPDGINWAKFTGNPVLTVGLPGSWDGGMIGFAGVILEGTGYKMWYTGISNSDFSGAAQIGYAISPDGLRWEKFAGNPVMDIGPSGWKAAWVFDPYVIFDGVTYKMWYSGFDRLPTCEGNIRTGYATSVDGITWVKEPATPVLDINSAGWDSRTATSPSVIFDGDTYHMWYHGGVICSRLEAIGYATSPDGISWTKYPGNPVLEPGQ